MMIADKTGWTKQQIMNDYSFAELNFMLADSPRLEKTKPKKLSTEEELENFFGSTIE